MMPSSALAQQQQALLALLFSSPGSARNAALQDLATCGGPALGSSIARAQGSTSAATSASTPTPTLHAQRGLQVYWSNAQALAERSLAQAYPVVQQLLGGDSFAALAQALWHSCPPVRGDLACWGGDLADFVAKDPQLAAEPYLGDLARLEWALHQVANAQDCTAEPASFALLSSQDPTQGPENLFLKLAPGLTVLASAWPVVAIHAAHAAADDRANGPANALADPSADTSDGRAAQVIALQQAGAWVQARVAQTAVVWRMGHTPCVREALPGEPEFLAAVGAGASLGAALELAAQLNLAQWLPLAVQTGLVWGVAAQSAPQQRCGIT